MATLQWNRLIGQDRVKTVIGSAFESGTLGHAYLFCGERGTGKLAAALDLAEALLCRGGGETRPCWECSSCGRVSSYSHPDFHIIMPLTLRKEHKGGDGLSEEGWAFAAESARARINDPYKIPRHDGIPLIPVDWIREADHAILRGATEGAFNVVIIDGVDTMRKESANAMLKTLEEPPPGTVMILLTDKIHSVLRTIVSRCQIIRFALLPPDVIGASLAGRFYVGADDPRVAAVSADGSLGAAIEEFEEAGGRGYEDAAELWRGCLRGDWDACVGNAERLSGGDDALDGCRQIFSALLRLLRLAFFDRFHAPINYINIGMSHYIELPDGVTPSDVERYAKLCRETLGALEARGNCAMAAANFVCTLMEMLNGEKQ